MNRFGTGLSAQVRLHIQPESNTTPGKVRNFVATHLSGTQYNLTWTAPSNLDANDPVLRYHYYYGPDCPGGGRPYVVRQGDENKTEFSITIHSGSEQFSMTAENSFDTGDCENSTEG